MNDEEVVKTAVKVSTVSIVVNVTLSLLKLAAGIIGQSMAMLSDAIHSLSDVVGSVIVIIGVKIAKKKEDHEHQYGHDKIECLASLALGAILLCTGVFLIYEGVKKIATGEHISTPGVIALIAAIVSIVTKEAMYWYTKINAKKINSDALKAEAWHHRSDALSSIGAFVGILGARLGYPILDPIASIVICVMIAKASIDIFRDAIDKMVDHSCDAKTEESMKREILKVPGVRRVDLLKTRLFGSKMYVDIEIAADGNISLFDAHDIAENVHHTIENKFKDVKHCMVHVNPING